MEEEKKLYPLQFCTLQDDYAWGHEEFKLADLGYRDSLVREGWLAGNAISEVMDMYVDRVVGEQVFYFYGRQFPVAVRNITVDGKMPLRVHPDDEMGQARYDFLGKEKLWYVVSADKDAGIMLGFRDDTDATQVWNKCLDNTIDELMNIVAVHPGQSFHIAPGTPHAAFGKLRILEISESSPLDFCMCGWGQDVYDEEFDPILRLEDALDFIDYRKYSGDHECRHHHHKDEIVHKLVELPAFVVSGLELTDPLHIYSENFESFIVYSCVSGEASVQIPLPGTTADFVVREGETLLVPAECPDFFLVPRASGTYILETTVHRDDPDPYINPDVEATLDDDDDDCGCEDHDCDCDHHHHHHS